MTYITATDGYFPHFFLNDLSTKEANRCIEVENFTHLPAPNRHYWDQGIESTVISRQWAHGGKPAQPFANFGRSGPFVGIPRLFSLDACRGLRNAHNFTDLRPQNFSKSLSARLEFLILFQCIFSPPNSSSLQKDFPFHRDERGWRMRYSGLHIRGLIC